VEFDFGVNSGTARALKWRAQMDQSLSPVAYVRRFCAKRQSFLEGLRTFSVFGTGWTRRVADVEATAVTMATKAAGKPVAPVLKKAQAHASKRAIGHTTAGTATGSALPALPDFDVSSTAGLVFFGICVATVVAYFVWNAVQQSHRANAYKEAAVS
jgi:lysozyme family protein